MQGTTYVGIKDIKPLGMREAPAGGCSTGGGSGKFGCGSVSGPAGMAPEVWEKVRNHPCYSEQAHHHYARMHVAVAPACNIQCNYCNRKYDCANESRPGVVSEKLTPEQGAKKVLAVASAIPQMSVVGIAGPGDALANPEKTFRTFELIARQAPDLKLCLSTNGLMLPDHVDTIQSLNVDHVTITINMTDPAIGEKIYPWIYYRNRRWTGREASRILSERQLLGLEMLTGRGILCKINSVMIPGINDHHLAEVNKAVKSRGAFLHNIMPLISAPEHGTVFGLKGQRGPTAQELKALQDSCEGGMNMMRHCRQCRADAVGLLGEDRSAEFSLDRIEAMEVNYDAAARAAYQESVEKQRRVHAQATEAAMQTLSGTDSAIRILVAVATKGGGRINEHFGHAKEFQVHEISAGGVKYVGHRRVDVYCQGGYDDDEALPAIVSTLGDCHAVFVAKIGGCPRSELKKAGIDPVETYAHAYIEQSAIDYFNRYLASIESGETVHRPRNAGGDAAVADAA